ncbi:MAG TPA: M56 family metallopeptidase [Gemmatimonas sp.]|nr:M56 family metallopeptidase [Gemmatimonas sp.]
MIAVWMLFSVMCGALVVVAGALLEPVVAASGRPRRVLWAVVVLCTALVVMLPLMRPLPSVAPDRVGVTRTAASGRERMAFDEVAVNDRTASAIAWAAEGWDAIRERTDAWNATLLGVWVGVGVMLLTFIVIGAHSRSLASQVVPALTDDALGHEVVMRPVGGPAATGVMRPRILLPPWILDLDPSLRAIVLRHEAEHIAARDPALLLGAVMLLVLLPWQLPLWYAVRRLKIAIEVDCDARVLRAFPDVRRYARLLLLVSQHFRTPQPSFRAAHAGLTTLGSARSHLKTRILVMTGSPARRFTAASLAQLAGAVGIAAVVAAMPAPKVRSAASSDAVTAQPPRKRVPPTPPVPASPGEPPSVVMPPRPPRPPLPEQPPVPQRFKRPLRESERPQIPKSARQQLLRSERDLEERLRIVRGQLAWLDSEREAAAVKPGNKKRAKPLVSPEIEEKMLRKTLKEQRLREDVGRKIKQQLDTPAAPKFKRLDPKRYDGRLQDTKVVPRT